METLISIGVFVLFGYALNSGWIQVRYSNRFWESWHDRLFFRHLFRFLMSDLFGVTTTGLSAWLFFVSWSHWHLLVAFCAGWWIGRFFYPRASDGEKNFLRSKLGGYYRRKKK